MLTTQSLSETVYLENELKARLVIRKQKRFIKSLMQDVFRKNYMIYLSKWKIINSQTLRR